MGFVMFVAYSKYGNAYPAFHKEYGFPYHLTPKRLKEIIVTIPYLINVVSGPTIKEYNLINIGYNHPNNGSVQL